jgi:outer membrane lipoprotein-sorting protein
MVKFFFCFTFLLSLDVHAEQISSKKLLEDMTRTYSQVIYMKSKFEKTETSQLLGDVTKTKGDIEYSKGKIRIDFKGKFKDLFIRGDKYFWHVSSEGEVLTGSVTKSIPNIFVSIFSDPKVWSELKSSYIGKPKKNIAHIEVSPKGKIPGIKKMNFQINQKLRTLVKLDYVDDVENKVTINFKSNKFYPEVKKDRFFYKPKKTDTVSRI